MKRNLHRLVLAAGLCLATIYWTSTTETRSYVDGGINAPGNTGDTTHNWGSPDSPPALPNPYFLIYRQQLLLIAQTQEL